MKPRVAQTNVDGELVVSIALTGEHLQALIDCFGIGYEGMPDDYPFSGEATEVSLAFDAYQQEQQLDACRKEANELWHRLNPEGAGR